MINRPDWINYCYEKEPDIEMLKKALNGELTKKPFVLNFWQ